MRGVKVFIEVVIAALAVATFCRTCEGHPFDHPRTPTEQQQADAWAAACADKPHVSGTVSESYPTAYERCFQLYTKTHY